MPGAKRDGAPLPPPGGDGDLSLLFCERCAREQEAYFAIGELSQELAVDRANQPQGIDDTRSALLALGLLGVQSSDVAPPFVVKSRL